MESKGELLQVVTQRVAKCRLMVSEEEDKWISSGAGLVVYASFIHSSHVEEPLDQLRLGKAVKSLMNSKLCTSSGWREDHSDAASIQGLLEASDTDTPTNIVVIPQATLAGKVKPGDKYLKYHRQIDKERSYLLYAQLLTTIVQYFDNTALAPDLTTSSCRIIPDKLYLHWGTYSKRQGFEFISTGPSTHYFEF